MALSRRQLQRMFSPGSLVTSRDCTVLAMIIGYVYDHQGRGMFDWIVIMLSSKGNIMKYPCLRLETDFYLAGEWGSNK